MHMVPYKSESQLRLPGFETMFEKKLFADNRWVKMAKIVPWDELAKVYGKAMSPRMGRPGLNPRLVFGALIIKHMHKETDEITVELIFENPYMQYFCGFTNVLDKKPFHPSMFVHFRKRLGLEAFNALSEKLFAIGKGLNERPTKKKGHKAEANSQSQIGDIVQDDSTLACETDGVKPHEGQPEALSEPQENKEPAPVAQGDTATEGLAADGSLGDTIDDILQANKGIEKKGVLMADATVASQNIRYPTDLGLLNEAREHTEKVIDHLCLEGGYTKKPRTYRKNARKAYLAMAKKRKKKAAAIKAGINQQLRYIRRNLGHIDRMLDENGRLLPSMDRKMYHKLLVVREIFRQQWEMSGLGEGLASVKNRLVSIQQPHVRPIVRGKDKGRTEFGAKVNVSYVNGFGFVNKLSWEAFNEGTLLREQLFHYFRLTGHLPEYVLIDQIYQTRNNRNLLKSLGIKITGKPLGRPPKNKVPDAHNRKLHNQRNRIEGYFGQAKVARHLGLVMAKLPSTSVSWICTSFLVMNLLNLLRMQILFCLFGAKQVQTVLQIHLRTLIQALVRPENVLFYRSPFHLARPRLLLAS